MLLLKLHDVIHLLAKPFADLPELVKCYVTFPLGLHKDFDHIHSVKEAPLPVSVLIVGPMRETAVRRGVLIFPVPSGQKSSAVC